MKGYKALFVICLLVAFIAPAWAVPAFINVQGRLTSGGSPVTADSSIVVAIYDRYTGGTPLWTSTPQTVRPDAYGVFSMIIGAGTAAGSFPEFTEDEFYLEIYVNGAPLGPRQFLASVPFAITARNVRGGTVVASTEGPVAIWGKGRSVGISGEATSTSSGIGVSGVSRGSNPLFAIGVYGGSTAIGVAGGGVTTLETANIGVWGAGSTQGVAGTSMTGSGVYGTGLIAGGSFESVSGYGVYAKTRAGGNKAALKAESTGMGPAYAIVAEITNSDNTASSIRGHTNGSGAGVYGWSEKGSGVWGYSPKAAGSFEGYSTGTAIYANNSGTGPALQIGPSGWLKMQILSVDCSTTTATIHSNVGILINTGTSARWVTVTCNRVKSSNSVVIASVVGGGGTTTGVKNIAAGSFDIWCDGKVAFMVINPDS